MYDFRALSPLDFEELVRDLLQAEFGLLFESFGPGRDLGIDFRFATAEGSTVVQAKHYADARSDSLVRSARAENDKVARLKPARYIFVTSVSLTPMLKKKLQDAIPAAPLGLQDILGRADLNNLIGRHSGVHKKHFKLWLASTEVLERILHSGVYNRTQAELDLIKAMVPKFVQNDSVSEAEAILQKNGVLIIAGEPGVGKSTLARMLVWLHAEQGWRISVIDDIGEAFAIASEDEKRLVFFDDFLGQIQLSSDLIRRTDQRFPPFLERVRTNRNIRFVLTTRDYILRQAQAHSSRLSATKVNAAQFTLSVGHYTRATKAQILYNHIYFADISLDERRALLRDDFFLKIIDHRNFNPRLIDLLTTADYISVADHPIRETVQHVLDNPQELWEKPYRNHFTEEARGLMLALFFNEGRVGLQALEGAFQRMIAAMGLSIGRAEIPVKFRAALKELEGSAIAIEDRHVRFANPGIRDFLQRAVREDRFFSVAVDAATLFYELKSTWDHYVEAVRHDSGLAIDGSLWEAAIDRTMCVASGTPLGRLGLSVDVYDQLGSEKSLEFVRASVAELSGSEIELDEADLSRWVLEALSMSQLPHDVMSMAGNALFGAVAQFLSERGGELSFDDIDAIAGALAEFGMDADVATRAHKKALQGRISDLSSILLDYGSVDELDGFELDLTELMINNRVLPGDVAAQIERRRETLIEYEQAEEEENYHPVQPVSSRLNATEQIRSMFAGLGS